MRGRSGISTSQQHHHRALATLPTPPLAPPAIDQLQGNWFAQSPPEQAALNAQVIAEREQTPKFMDIGMPEYRELRHREFKHGDAARMADVSFDGADGHGPEVGGRLFFPQTDEPRGALLHLHGGGFVTGSAKGQSDERLLRHAERCKLAVLSVDYRLSPEHTYPTPGLK